MWILICGVLICLPQALHAFQDLLNSKVVVSTNYTFCAVDMLWYTASEYLNSFEKVLVFCAINVILVQVFDRLRQ